MRKILFLDIDGVLNTERQHDYCVERGIAPVDGFSYSFDPEAVANLTRIVEQTGADIVLSSSWKYWGLSAMQNMWANRGLPGKIIDITPDTVSDDMLLSVDLDMMLPAVKGSEIKEWLAISGSQVTRYAILDDQFDMLPEQQPNFVQTDPRVGITGEDANSVIAILTDMATVAGPMEQNINR